MLLPLLLLACAPTNQHPPDGVVASPAHEPIFFVSAARAADEDPPPVVQEMHDVVVEAQKLSDRSDAIEHYLSDQLAVKDGKAPKGWVQPPLEDYMAPGAPASFLPGAVVTPTPTPPTHPAGPTP